MEKASVTRYVHLARDLYAFILRIANGASILSRGSPLPPLDPVVLSAAEGVLRKLRSEDATTGNLHQLAVAVLQETVSGHTVPGAHSRTNPVTLFIIYKSVAASGVIRDPDSIQNILSAYKWTTRASAFSQLTHLLEAEGRDIDEVAMKRLVSLHLCANLTS